MQEVIGSNPIFSTNSKAPLGAFFMMIFYTYILYSKSKDKFYVGHTSELDNRLIQHNTRKNLGTNDWSIVYYEIFKNRSEAMKRESEIKNKRSRKYIEWMIQQNG